MSLGIICSNRNTEKLKLLYILHLPPLLPRIEIANKKQNAHLKDDNMEIATEAEEFFSEDTSESIEALPSLIDVPMSTGGIGVSGKLTATTLATNIEYPSSSSNVTPNLSIGSTSTTNLRNSVFYVDLPNDFIAHQQALQQQLQQHTSGFVYDSVDTGSDISDMGFVKTTNHNFYDSLSQNSLHKYEAQFSTASSTDTRSLNSLRVFFDQPDGNFTRKTIPNITQMNFIALWTSLLELMGRTDSDIQNACKYRDFS